MAPRPVTPVGIAADLLASVGERLEGTPGLDADVRADLARAAALVSGLEPYVEHCTTRASSALAMLEERTQAEDWSGGGGLEQEMLSGHVEGALLQMLVRISGARRVLEIGMFTGYAALAMAEALPPGGRVVACEIDPRAAAVAAECFAASPVGHLVDVRVGPALATLAQLTADGEAFDLVFLDAEKAGYAGYLDVLLDGLLAPRGVVCVDNTLLQGEPWSTSTASVNGAAIAAFNERVAADPRVEQVLVPVRDGLTLVCRV